MQQEKILNLFSFKKVIIPILIGILTALYLVYRDMSKNDFSESLSNVTIQWTGQHTFYLLLAIFLVLLRDLAYIYRIRLLTDKKLSWYSSFQVIMLWEFASSLTPSVVGGSAVALFIVNKEGISAGKSTAIVMITALLDELFYIIIVPIAILIAGFGNVFADTSEFKLLGESYSAFWIFCIGYSFIFILISFISYGVFVRPIHFKHLLHKLFGLKYLRRWQPKVEKWGDDLLQTSAEMKGKSIVFWFRAFGATAFSWTARFFMLNSLIMIVNPHLDQFLALARQLVMWVILLISPTPGGAGVAEYALPVFMGEFIPTGLASSIAILWRLLSYYPYIIVGSLVLPLWIKRVYKRTK